MIKGIVVGVLAYSAILTIFLFYKDNSGYYIVGELDVILGGPVSWFAYACVKFIALIVNVLHIKPKKKEYKPKSKAEIRKNINKIIFIYKKNHNIERSGYEIFDFTKYKDYDGNGIEGWDNLMVKKPRYERINDKFERIMWKQEDEAIPILKELSSPVTSEFLKKQDYYSKYFICEIEDKIKGSGCENYRYIPQNKKEE